MSVKDSFSMKTEWEITRFKDPTGEIAEFLRKGGSIDEAVRRFKDRFIHTEKWKGNVALQEGRQEILDIICGLGSPTLYDHDHAYLGVGDSATAPVETQTGLLGTNKSWMPIDETYPQRSNQTVEWRATWDSTHGNYSWQEFTVVNASDDTGKNINRCTADKGTKVSGETWTLSLKITINAT